MRPDPVFYRLIRESLERIAANLRDFSDGAMNTFSGQTRQIFSAGELLPVVEQLIAAHQSDKLFVLTAYHYLILYEALADIVQRHNRGEAQWLYGLQVDYIDFDAIVDIYFWNDDFLYPQQMFDAIADEDKQRMGFTEETYGVVHRLRPQLSQIELGEIDEMPQEWHIPSIFRMSEDYPLFSDGDIGG